MLSDTTAGAAVAAAVSEWRDAIGSAYVSTDSNDLRRSGTATFPTASTVTAILRPADRAGVQRCVRIANRYRIPLYPVSTGKNWGYGSRSPVRDAALLDLGRLNRVIELNEELGYVTLEPGVTQQQLYDYLRERGSHFWMDATGASPDCSIIGNTLERGFGHTPMGDHCSHACGFEVVLPTGDCIETGFGRFPDSRATPVSRWGTGPSLDGLFSQSNLGIVTRMTIWLMPAPDHYCAFFVQTEGPIGEIVDALRPLRLNGTIRSVVHIGNDYKVLSSGGQYPWTEANGVTPLPRDVVAQLKSKHGIGRWNASGGLYGTRTQVREARAALRRAVEGKASRLKFVDRRTLTLARALEKPYRMLTGREDLSRALRLAPPLLGLLAGVPTTEFLKSAYWRKRTPPPDDADPDRDMCGLLWSSPVAPSIGADVQAVADISEERLLAHGFEPLISVSLINERATISTVALTYDREVPGEDARAVACYREVTARLLERGYPPYRLNSGAMDVGRPEGAFGDVIRAVKKALDPHGILAPGRYE